MKSIPNEPNELDTLILECEKPGRYAGGEYGSLDPIDIDSDDYIIAVCYPDLYEIGMSNLAIRLLYNLFNSLDGVRCERIFAPAQDLENSLRSHNYPLFTLESRIPLHQCDLICFSVGYELTLTNLLTILDLGGVEVLKENRSSDSPIVIAGGPGSTNPAPLEHFVDAFYAGEGEPGYRSLIHSLSSIKGKKNKRELSLRQLSDFDFMYVPGFNDGAKRIIDRNFGQQPMMGTLLPVPSLKTVQDHGVCEIMRGCPQGCRFCHATYYYRPFRVKKLSAIVEEIDRLVFHCGYHEITLSSLSSADYPHIEKLLSILNERYKDWHISFSLPSLRVNSLTLPLIEMLSKERRSGLTFAIESAEQWGQRRNNKEVNQETVIAVLNEAKQRGWRSAKFYFMVGLPGADHDGEADSIIHYMKKIIGETGIYCHVNIGTFIPKPHTPFEHDEQISEEEGVYRIQKVRRALKGLCKVGYHSPFMSYLEGIFSRGSQETASILLLAWQRGARFDAWDDHIDWNLWRRAIEDSKTNLSHALLEDSWKSLNFEATDFYLEKEKKKSEAESLTDSCGEECHHPCGACYQDQGISRDPQMGDEDIFHQISWENMSHDPNRGVEKRFLLEWSKKGRTVFLSHLDVYQVFVRAFLRSLISLVYSQGKNPKPKLEIAQPLSLGVSSEAEYLSFHAYMAQDADLNDWKKGLTQSLPRGLEVSRLGEIPIYDTHIKEKKTPSLMSLYGGADYRWTLSKNLMKKWLSLIQHWEGSHGIPLIKSIEKDCLVLKRNQWDQPGLKGGIMKTLMSINDNNSLSAEEILALERIRMFTNNEEQTTYWSAFFDSDQ